MLRFNQKSMFQRKLPSINPNKISRSLSESIDGNVRGVKILQSWPPASMQVIDVFLLAQRLNSTPISIRCCKPLAIARTDVHVYRAEVVVLLMSWCSAVRNFHVELNCVHSENRVSNMWQHVRRWDDSCEGWKFLKFVELSSPFSVIRQIHVCSKPARINIRKLVNW